MNTINDSQDQDYLPEVTITTAASDNGTIRIKQKRPKISYKTELLKSERRVETLFRWSVIGWAIAIVELVWLITLAVAE